MNKKERRVALISLLSAKAADQSIKVIDSFSIDCARTKTMSLLVKTMGAEKSVLAVTREEMARVQGAQNLATVKVLNIEYLNPHDLLKYTNLVFSKSSLEHLYLHFQVTSKIAEVAPKKTTRKKKEEVVSAE